MKNKKNFSLSNFALMQGRLVDSEKKNEIQFFPKKNWKKELGLFRKNKIKYIEWVASYENLEVNPILEKKKILTIKKECKKNQVKIRSIDIQFFVKKPIYKGKIFEKKKSLQNIKQIFINSQLLDIKYFIIPALENASLNTKNKKKVFIELIKNLLNLIKTGNFILIESDLSPKKMKLLLSEINSKNVGINYDTGNSAGKGYYLNEEKKYFKFVKNIHLKDKKFKGKSVQLGKGSFDFNNFFKYLKNINYKGDFAFQTARSKDKNHINEYKLNLEYIKNYV
jgi:sugar phosphate isomerase/epimerase